MKRLVLTTLAAAACLYTSASSAVTPVPSGATIIIVNGDPAGVGFNDPTVVAPVGGNTGTTLGAQRLNAFQAAASKWGATLSSSVTIRVMATWAPLTCTSTSAVLGSAGATEVFSDFAGAPQAGAWYGKAQTAKLTGSDPDSTTADIRARFNVNLGNANCLPGTPFYLGLDNNHGSKIDLVTVLTHEFGHGLGFQTYTDGSTGEQLGGVPSIWDFYLKDSSTGKLWKDMSDSERAASSLKSGKLVWTGAITNNALAGVLQQGAPALTLISPASIAGSMQVGAASFGPALSSPGMTGEIMPVVDSGISTGLACNPLSAANAAAVSGKIALVDRGVCAFTIKAKNVQNAGAIGVIVADNAAGSPPPGLGGTDASVVIPAVRITLDDGIALKAALAKRTRLHSNVYANLGVNMALRAGADLQGRMQMFAPNPYQGGSSVSHFDTGAFPNQLMEPAINGDLTHEVTAPNDLSYSLLRDIGW
ncbi:PA domain-containing protein [Duganella qianjiadongensis]|uniref:Peptidase n=1 Tax=Duganella qianjiadongensis TaxID=2692176 RepID=A0ABW9VH14_9BURK|nr:PA domain-containing protein [Duganella qianjiadongensis]MYM37869.1 peptidase [Duganella qianjiadongensis]